MQPLKDKAGKAQTLSTQVNYMFCRQEDRGWLRRVAPREVPLSHNINRSLLAGSRTLFFMFVIFSYLAYLSR